jgi:hypothetical protein
MTELMTRPILRVRPTDEPPRRPVAVSALVAGVAAAVLGLTISVALAVGAWFAGDTGTFGDAVRVGGFGWLVGNGTGVRVAGVSFTAVPLGLLAGWAYAVYRLGRWSGQTSAVRHGGDVVSGTLLIAVGYAGTGLAVRELVTTDSAEVPIIRCVVALLLVGMVFGGIGLVHGSDSVAPVLALIPPPVRACLSGAVAGVAIMFVASSAVLIGSLVVHFSDAVTLQEGLAGGGIGAIAVALIGAASVPNAVLCAGAFVAGPGFAVGTGTTVAPGDVSLGQVPGLPLLAALPAGGEQAWWQPVLILVPVLAGAVAGLVTFRRDPAFGLDQAALRGAGSGLVGGLAFGASTWLATGSIGPGRMQDIGPFVLATSVVCAVAFLLGGGTAAVLARWWQSFRPHEPAAAEQTASV